MMISCVVLTKCSFNDPSVLLRNPPSRCGSVTFGGKQRTVLFSNTLRPLRYPKRGGKLSRLRYINGEASSRDFAILKGEGLLSLEKA